MFLLNRDERMARIRAGLVGISGYAGMELARLLACHPEMELTMACSRGEAGKDLGDFYPFLRHLPGSDVEISVYDADDAASRCDLVFLAVPAGTAMKMAPELLARNLKVIDFSADFRLHDGSVYEEWYGQPHSAADHLPRAVYGLPELGARAISQASLVANPGCYPTSIILGLYAALKHGLVHPDGIIADSKSGASGAGRKAAVPTLFCEVSDNFRPYGSPRHRHTPEIEQELSLICGEDIKLTFTPHLTPMKRGILSTIYCRPVKKHSLEEIHGVFQEVWKDSPWIRVLPLGQLPETANVRGSMFCDIALTLDKRADRLMIFSAIDNLCRGASGQALANGNLMCGLPVDAGMEELAPLV